MSQPASPTRIHFGVFEVDPAAGELRKHGIRIRLQEQPFQVLLVLLERPGELVTREELRQRLWPADTFVDFDQSLNRAINKVREALGDVSGNPRFIETLPRRGYRFVAPVDGPARQMEPEPRLRAASTKLKRRWYWIVTAVVALGVTVGLADWILIPPRPPVVRLRQITTDSEPKNWPALTDGARVYFINELPEARLLEVPVSGGRSVQLSFVLPGSRVLLQDLSPDGQEFLLTAADARTLVASARTGPAPLWTVRVSDGAARRVGSAAVYTARYSPDGGRIAWSTDERLYVAAADGSGAREVASMPGWSLDVTFWSAPDRIILTCSEKKHPAPYTWQVALDGSGLHRVLPRWDRPHDFAGFTPDGRFMILLSSGTLWSLPVPHWQFTRDSGLPAQITFGTPGVQFPFRTHGGRLFVQGVVQLGELQRLDQRRRVWQRHLDGISADCVEYSPDGQWVAYVRYPERTVWRCRADGTQCLQLADGRLAGYLPHWSPDGRTIAFNALVPGRPWRIWLVNADGSNLRLAAPAYAGGQLDPAWTADGKSIVFATGNVSGGGPTSLRILDIGSGRVSGMPGADGLFSPRSSPDRTRLLALSSDARFPASLMILDPATGLWRRASEDFAAFPSWAPDNRSILYHNTKAILRFRLDTWRTEPVASIDRYDDFRANGGWRWVGQDPDGAALVMRNRDVTQFYEVDFAPR